MDALLPIIDLVIMGNNRSIITIIIGNNDLVIICNNDVITSVTMSNHGDIITIITGNNIVITWYNECKNDGLISNKDGNNEEKQAIMM